MVTVGGGREREVRRRRLSPLLGAFKDDVTIGSSTMEILRLSFLFLVLLLALEIRSMMSTFLWPDRNRRRGFPELPLDET